MEAWRQVELAACEELPGAARRGRSERRRSSRRSVGATFTVEEVAERERVTEHDVAAFVDVLAASAGEAGRWIHFGLTSSDVLDTALALQLRAAGEVIVAGARELVAALAAPRARARGDAVRRAHPRRARRADDLRDQARGLRLRGRPQRRAPRARLRPGRRRRAVGRRRHLRGHQPRVRGAGARAAGAGARGRLHPGRPARPPRGAAARRSRSRAPASSASRPRSATCSAPRCARCRSRSGPARRAPRRCPTSATRSRASRSPGSRGCCAATPRRRSRTSRCGTSATSRTPPSSG